MTIPPRVKPEEKRKEREKHENNPCTLPTREKEKDAGLTSVRVRINESGLLVILEASASEAVSLSV